MQTTNLPTIEDFKEEAKQLRKENPEKLMKHSHALEQLAKNYGFKSWRALKPLLVSKDDI